MRITILATSKRTPNQKDYDNFINSVKSQKTRKDYAKSFGYYLNYVGKNENDLVKLLEEEPKDIQSDIIDFINYLQNEKKSSSATVNAYVAAVKRFYEMNDIVLNWRKIHSYKNEFVKAVEDQPYTKDQIRLLLEKTDQRNRAIILLMACAGLRVGSIPNLKVGDLTPINELYGGIYQITTYKKSASKYITFCTPECRKEIDGYLEYRRLRGEQITPDSLLFRKNFNGYKNDDKDINSPKPLTAGSICFMVNLLLSKATRIRTSNGKRHNLMQCHGFRKFFATTISDAGVDSVWVEMLTGHRTGLKEIYNKPKSMTILQGNDRMFGYASAIDRLTINQENKLKAEVVQLKAKVNEVEALKQKMLDMENTIREMRLIRDNPSRVKDLVEMEHKDKNK